MPSLRTIEVATSYLEVNDKLPVLTEEMMAAAQSGFGGIVGLGALLPLLKERLLARRMNKQFAREPIEDTPACLRHELVSALDRAYVVLGMPVGDNRPIEEL